MNHLFPEDDARARLEQRWIELTREKLPSVAAECGWPIHLDHCFQRVLLDAACGTVWYDYIAKRPAHRNAPDDILGKAVELGEQALKGKADMDGLNIQSLRYRRKTV